MTHSKIFLLCTQQVYSDHNAPITHCQFSPNGVRAASVDTRGSLRLVTIMILEYVLSLYHLESGSIHHPL